MKPYIKTGLIWTVGAFLIMALISAGTWSSLPAGRDIPVHWGVNGEPDRYAGRNEAGLVLMAMPVIMLLTAWFWPSRRRWIRARPTSKPAVVPTSPPGWARSFCRHWSTAGLRA
mgnify:FL=1|jgi:hypothetical protein